MKVLEMARSEANLMYQEHEQDQVVCLDKLAAFYVLKSKKEKNSKTRDELRQQATQFYTMADKIKMYDTDHLLGRACFCLQDKTKIEQAQQQFQFVLEHDKENVKAMLGMAAICFERQDYQASMSWYRKALTTNPSCNDADIRLGIGICAYKLDKLDKARAAFNRALELDSSCVGALVGLAVLELNTKFQNPDLNNIKQGTLLLSRAYNIENENPIVLVHLADHFFYKGEYHKTKQLALGAIRTCDMDEVKAEAYYHLGRCAHVQNDFENAFHYYYKSTQLSFESYQTYVLPHYGLGQLFIHRSKAQGLKEHSKIEYLNKAIECFERVLVRYTTNYESMKILGTLYSYFSSFKAVSKTGQDEVKFNQPEAYKKAIKHFKEASKLRKDDPEVMIAFAQLLERSDASGALEQYERVLKLYEEEEDLKNLQPPVEILNNIANLYAKKQDFEKVKIFFDKAISILDAVDKDTGSESTETKALRTTIKYNLGRYYEQINEQQKAIVIYKQITKTVPKYVDAYLRLGCIFKSRGYFFDADEWFRETIPLHTDNADSWALLGNLRFAKKEWGPGQKHFENLIKKYDNDTYALLSLANLWINMYYQSNQSHEKSERRLNHSEQSFKDVLKRDDKNIFAACGLGCVLALKKKYAEATDIFTIVREASGSAGAAGGNENFGNERSNIHKDVWLNLGHCFMDQSKFAAAVQVYESAIRKFDLDSDEEVLLAYARALFKLSRFDLCRKVVVRARHLYPHSHIILYNLGILLKVNAQKIMQSEKSQYKEIKDACDDLELASQYFQHLKTHGEKTVFHFPRLAGIEAKAVKDLTLQARQTEARAKKQEEDAIASRKKQQEYRKEMRLRIEKERADKELEKKEQAEKLRKAREEQQERTKQLISQIDVSDFKNTAVEKEKSGRGRKKNMESPEYDSDGQIIPKKKKGKSSRSKNNKSTGQVRSDSSSSSSDDNDSRMKLKQNRNKAEVMRQEKPGQYKSKAFIEDSSSDDSVGGDTVKRDIRSSDDDLDTSKHQKVTSVLRVWGFAFFFVIDNKSIKNR